MCARWFRSLALTTILLAFAGCTGEATSRTPEVVSDGGPSLPETDGGAAATTPPACTAEGNPAACDPVTGDGCGTGTCYLVRNQGPSCVCEGNKGTVVEGKDCNTTTECGQGLVCAGTKAPGTCRKTCDPTASGCLEGSYCRAITAFPSYGYCDTGNTGNTGS